MSRKVGLCDTHFETDVDGDVDFSFFGEQDDEKLAIAGRVFSSQEVNNNANARRQPASEHEPDAEEDQSSPLSSSSSSCCSSSSSQRHNYDVGDSDFESDSEITDVSPLSSANMSPLPTDSPKQIRDRSATYKPPTSHQDPVDMKLLAKAIVEMDEQRSCCSKTGGRAVVKPKKNRSFGAEEARRIELENQRLLRRLLQHQQRKPSAPKGGPCDQPQMRKVASSAVNRRRKQQQIEEENLGLLKRLQAAKPTKELSRNYLLRDVSKGATSQPRPATSASSSARSSVSSAMCPSSHSCPSLPTTGPLGDGNLNVRDNKSRDSS